MAGTGERGRRHSIRLPHYDYASPGAYFVTVCTYARQPLFQEPALKEIVEQTWYGQQERFPGVWLDAFVVMPNHVHFIVWLDSVGAPLAGAHDARQTTRAGASPAPTRATRAGASPARTLGEVVGTFKSIVATEWLKWLEVNAPHRSGRVWQRNYYERVLRNEQELARVREYIQLIPLKWEFDHENPYRIVNRGYECAWGWLEGHKMVGARHASPLRHMAKEGQ